MKFTAIHECDRGNAFDRVCLSVLFALYLMKGLTWKVHVWYAGTEGYLGQVRISRSSGQGQGHMNKNEIYERKQTRTFTGGPPSIERHLVLLQFRIFLQLSPGLNITCQSISYCAFVRDQRQMNWCSVRTAGYRFL